MPLESPLPALIANFVALQYLGIVSQSHGDLERWPARYGAALASSRSGLMARYVFHDRVLHAAAALALLILLGSFTGSAVNAPLITANLPLSERPGGPTAVGGLPSPEPLVFNDIDPEMARRLNDAIPFSAAPIQTARPFAFAGDASNREKAVDCLAAAMWYEAGNDDIGQRSVGQVVLNRVRHPAFPNSVCGVVFQGSERPTGCQFTFTCDGAMRRTPSAAAWTQTRARALAALGGDVYAPVGLATHYHTDWVHPVWSAKLDKIARVHTHLFFRWTGKWGGPAAMTQNYAAKEQPIVEMANLSVLHRAELSEQQVMLTEAGQLSSADTRAILAGTNAGSLPLPAAAEKLPDGVHFIQAGSKGNGGALAMHALNLCGSEKFCKVVGWDEKAGHRSSLPVTAADRAAIAFIYIRDRRTGVDRALWDCERFERQSSSQCLGTDSARWIDFNGNFQSDRRSGAQII